MSCCVVGCMNRFDKHNKTRKFYRIPSTCTPFKANRRRLWLQAIGRSDWNEQIIKNAKICSDHFVSGEASEDYDSPSFVPSIFPYSTQSGKDSDAKLERMDEEAGANLRIEDKSFGHFYEAKWTREEDDNLKILISTFGKKDWKTICSFLPGRTQSQCCQRWRLHLKPQESKVNWTKKEDEKLTELVHTYGTKQWAVIAEYLTGRVGRQCRERWCDHLNPLLAKNSWTDEEDIIIYKAHSILGERWADIARLLPGRSENTVKNHWTNTVKQKAESGFFNTNTNSISLDIQQFVEGEVDFKCDVVLDAEPVTPEVIRYRMEQKKFNRMAAVSPQHTVASGVKLCGPPLPPGVGSGSSSSSSAAPATAPVDQKKLVDAALRMIAEDMLPLSFVEGPGFRSFMSTIKPEYNKLSQHAIVLQLYEDVERTFKPQLIRELKACLASTKDAQAAIHVTFDLWAGDQSNPAEEPIVIVQLHFINNSWQIRRPVVAFRNLCRKNLSAMVARELEGVLLSYGIFPQNIGYVLVNPAKEALAANSLFCDYKIMCASNRGEPDGEDVVKFLSDQMSEAESAFSDLQIATKTACVAKMLLLVIKEALKHSRLVENLLSQVHNVVAFFKSSVYWSEALFKESGVSLCPSSSNCRWNSMMVSLRRMVQESTWSYVMTILAQARIEASDAAGVPPLIMVKREQVVDILGLLEPFQGTLQVLQGNGVTVSHIIPSLIALDKALEKNSSNYTHFCKALRTGLHTYFQSLIHQKDLILAVVLDPRKKLKQFPDVKSEDQIGFLKPPSKRQAHNIVRASLESVAVPANPSMGNEGQTNEEIRKKQDGETEGQANMPTNMSSGNSDNSNCNGHNGNDLKRKSGFSRPEPPSKTMKMSELDTYLAEPCCESNSNILLFWKAATRFPKLQSLAKTLLAVPATSGGFDRLCPMATCIVRAKRNHIPPHTTERLLLYKNTLQTNTAKKPSAVRKGR